MVLEALEAGLYSGLTEKVSLPNDLTIEHVLPQEWSTHWPLPDGADPFQGRLDRDVAKHRLGNLTLVTGRLNPKMSNATVAEIKQGGPSGAQRDADLDGHPQRGELG